MIKISIRGAALATAAAGVLLIAAVGQSVAGLIIVEPDNFADGADISNAVAGVTLSAFDGPPDLNVPLTSAIVRARTATEPGVVAPTGSKVFGNDSKSSGALPLREQWFGTGHQFRADFAKATNFVSIDIAANDSFDPAILRAFDSSNSLLASFTTLGNLGPGVVEVASITRPEQDIKYITITNPATETGESFVLDNLQFTVPEPATLALFGLGLAGLGFRKLKTVPVFTRLPRRSPGNR